MDENGIEATQALDLGDYDDEDVTDDELGVSTPVAYLNVACQKGFPGKLFPVYEGDNVIGRGDECKISIPLKALSREHACIEVKGDAHFIYDKGSRNRTRRNNHFLAASVRYELKDKDKLIFGDVECEYQVGTKAADASDETGSESMFQTAPDDEELKNSPEINNETEVKSLEDEDYASDASSDILEPTQPSVGNTQSMLGHKTLSGTSTLAQNITVKETPAAPRTKRFTEDIVLPESGSDTDDGYSTKPPATLAIVADSQDDDDGEEELKSRVMGAATQAYVCESDISTDAEEDMSHKRSLLAAPTQAFVDDDDSTCSEHSPKKKMLLTAATQAFAADTDEEKKQDQLGPTVPYTMVVDIEPTQGYDMEVDAEEKNENEEEGKKRSSILYEPTQAYLESETKKDQDKGEGSDTSEEFVLEGDTDAEDEGDVEEMLAAPTFACDEADQEVAETQVVSTEDPTQVFDNPKPTGKKGGHKLDETLPVTEQETQVFEDNNKTSKKTVTSDDATQVFDENIQDGKNNELEAMSHAADTQVIDEKATQVFDTERKNEQTAETQVFNDDATQCFDDENNEKEKGSGVENTKVFDEPKQVVDGESDKNKLAEQNETATQVFDKVDDVVIDDEGRTFDITAASTLAVNEDLSEDSNDKTGVGTDDATQVFDSTVGVDQTVQIEEGICQKESRGKRKKNQVEAETLAVSDATQVLTEEPVQSKSKNGKKKQIERNNDEDDATQVFDETIVVEEDETVANKEEHTVAVDDGGTQIIEDKPVTKTSQVRKKNKITVGTLALSDDAKQMIDQTVPVTEGETVAVTEDETVVVTEDETVAVTEGETVPVTEGETVAVTEDETVPVTEGETVAVTEDEMVAVTEDETVAVTEDETVAVTEDETVTVTEDQTVALTEDETNASHECASHDLELKPSQSKASRGKRKQAKKDISQDETVVMNENQTVALTEENPDANKAKLSKVKTSGRRKQVEKIDEKVTVNKEATRVLDENVQGVEAEKATVKPVLNPNVKSKGKRNNASKKVKNATVAENMEGSKFTESVDLLSVEVNEKNEDEPNSITTRRSTRTRGKPSIPKNGGKKEEALLNESKKTEQKDDKTKEINESKQSKRGKKTGIANKKAEVEATANISAETEQLSETASQRYGDEAATQRYGDEAATQRYGDSGDEAATQRYGDSGDEASTQKYGEVKDEDLTPDLDEIVEEKKEFVPVVAETPHGRSTLKSALASPQKATRPSPKKVQFVSQDSETDSESTGPKRRSKRGNKGKQKVVETEPSITSKETKSVLEIQSKKTRQKAVLTIEKVHSETDREGEAVKESHGNNETVESVVKCKEHKHQERNKDIEISGNSDNAESGPIANVAIKSTRRGRKSVDAEVNNKEENNKRKARVSLPAVLEENKLVASKNRGKKKVNKTSGDEEGNTNDKMVSDKKELRGKDIIHEQKQEENKSDTTHSEKRSARHTKEAVEENKTKNPEEARSNTPIDNSEKIIEPKSTRSCRNVRKTDKNEALESKNSISKDKEHENVKADGDKKEPSIQESARTRKSKCYAEENQTCEVIDGKGSVVIADDKVSARSKAGRRGNRKSNVKSEVSDSQINEVKSDLTDKNTEETDSIDKLTNNAQNSGKGKKAKSEPKIPADDKNSVKTDQEVNKRSKGSSRIKKGDVSKGHVKGEEQEGLKEDNLTARSSRYKGAVNRDVKEEKQEQLKEDNLPTRSRRLKRKESDNSSNDSQESERETPAKKQKQKRNNLSTPKNKGKETCTVTTPRQLDTSITNSPTLRKTTTEGGKAKVMFTGVIDEQGEKIVKELGGELVSSVTECTHLVTDQVRRTVKFLCCLAQGIPIVSTQWLASSKTSAFFVDPTPFLVQDDASERKYKFCLDQSIDKASKEQVFQGFTFHVTKSVKPEPQHMSEILKCAGAKYTNKMPCSGQGLTVVISCPEDQGQCEPAYEAGIPVMTAEFVLTGILRQEVDFQSFRLVKEENGRKRQATTLSHETSKKRKR